MSSFPQYPQSGPQSTSRVARSTQLHLLHRTRVHCTVQGLVSACRLTLTFTFPLPSHLLPLFHFSIPSHPSHSSHPFLPLPSPPTHSYPLPLPPVPSHLHTDPLLRTSANPQHCLCGSEQCIGKPYHHGCNWNCVWEPGARYPLAVSSCALTIVHVKALTACQCVRLCVLSSYRWAPVCC